VEESEEEPVQYTQDIRRTVRKGNYLKWNENKKNTTQIDFITISFHDCRYRHNFKCS
jgi:hypothetical protein